VTMQNNIYLLSFDPYAVDLNLLTQYLLRHQRISTWRFPALPGSILISSPADLVEIQGIIGSHMDGLIHLVTQVNPMIVGGWADHATWDFIKNPGASSDTLPKQGQHIPKDLLPTLKP